MEYCCHAWADAAGCYLKLLDIKILEGGPLAILIEYIIFLSPFLDVSRMSMSTVSFLARLDPGIICLHYTFL